MKPRASTFLAAALAGLALVGCTTPLSDTGVAPATLATEKLLIVDCLLPPQVRQLGAFATGVSPRQPRKLPAYECEQAGGEYALASRDPKAALAIWLPFAQRGEAQAQTQVGELYERGIGALADPATAANWYRRAAEQGDARAAINLASLYERGLGVERDTAQAAQLFRRASGLPPAPARLSIHIVEPLIVLADAIAGAGAAAVRLPGKAGVRELVGRVVADAGVRSVTVNGAAVAVESQGGFRARLDLSGGSVPLQVDATDRQGNKARIAFTAVAGEPAAPAFRPADGELVGGEYHALIIANQHYEHWEPLDTPLRDARDLKALLERRYGFKVTLLADASRRDFFVAFNALRAKLGALDNLLVFYAGHGDIDPVTQRGYWVPVDGERRNRSRWVSVLEVTDQLNALSARQVLVVADSCYSGTMARSSLPAADAELAPALKWNAMRTMARQRARVVLTSGGIEPVADGGAGANSLFARSLLDVLSAVTAPIEARRVHEELAARFALRAERLNLRQRPEYAPIRFAGHEAGDFVFIPQR
jgi:uncharacterized protein